MQIFNIEEAEEQLSELMDRAIAGERILIGPGSKPLVMLVPYNLPTELANAYLTSAYAEMAADKAREAEANEWCESLAGDGLDSPADEFKRLKHLARESLPVSALSDAELSAIAAAEVPASKPAEKDRKAEAKERSDRE